MPRKKPLGQHTPQKLPASATLTGEEVQDLARRMQSAETSVLTPANPDDGNDCTDYIVTKDTSVWLEFPDLGIAVYLKPVKCADGLSVELFPVYSDGTVCDTRMLAECGATKIAAAAALKAHELGLE
jgi:hypothetical protein